MKNVVFSNDLMFVRSKDSMEADISGETVLMSIESAQCYSLDPVGAFVWKLLQQPANLAELQQKCREEYAGDPAQIDADVEQLVTDLLREKLIAG